MHDRELFLCIHPVDPRLAPLLAKLGKLDLERERRAACADELRSIATAELVDAANRWTPHYDRGLRAIVESSADLLLEPQWDYDPSAEYDPSRYDECFTRYAPTSHIEKPLDVHTRLLAQLEAAERAGARTLAAAFDLLTIDTRELPIWFELCPAPDALDRRLRAAAFAYLRATRVHDLDDELLAAIERGAPAAEIHRLRMSWFATEPSPDRNTAVAIASTVQPATNNGFGNVPLAVLQLLGNPFDPLA